MNIKNRLEKLENEYFAKSAYSAFCGLPKAERLDIAKQGEEKMKRLSDAELEQIRDESSPKLGQAIKELTDDELYFLSIGEPMELSAETRGKLRSAGFGL